MKVQITYTEVQTFKNTIEVEMTEKEYKDYLKKSLTEHEEIFGDLIVAGNKYNVNCPILMSSYIKMKIYQEIGL